MKKIVITVLSVIFIFVMVFNLKVESTNNVLSNEKSTFAYSYYDSNINNKKVYYTVYNGQNYKSYYSPYYGNPIINEANKSETDSGIKLSDIYFVGESRMLELYMVNNNVGWGTTLTVNNSNYLAKAGAGYTWFKENISTIANTNKNYIVIGLGTVDLGSIYSYISEYVSLAKSLSSKNIYILAVNPCTTGGTYYVNNTEIEMFNSLLKKGIEESGLTNLKYIDTYSMLSKEGYETRDGLHYTKETYEKISAYVVSTLNNSETLTDKDNTSVGNDTNSENNTTPTTPEVSHNISISDIYFVGESRMLELYMVNNNVGWGTTLTVNNSNYLAKAGAGYTWFKENISTIANTNKNYIVIGLGTVDLGSIYSYISEYASLAKSLSSKNIYILAVNPCTTGGTYYVNNTEIEMFNSLLKKGIEESGLTNLKYIDTYSMLSKEGYETRDGLHYTKETYEKISAYVVSTLNNSETLTDKDNTNVGNDTNSENNTTPTVPNAKPHIDASDIYFVGDSRTLELYMVYNNIGWGATLTVNNKNFLAKAGAGYTWFKENINTVLKTDKDYIVLGFGGNDLGSIYSYISEYISLAKKLTNKNIYVLSVNPSTSGGIYYINNLEIEIFNSLLKKGIEESGLTNLKYIDTYSMLTKQGYETRDGVHYTKDTYNKISNYLIYTLNIS